MPEIATVKIYRFDPLVDKEPRYETYNVPPDGWEGLKVRDTLTYIYENLDCGLSFRESCRHMQLCGACVIMINKKPGLACDILSEKEMVIEPIPNHKVLKDLVVDFSAKG